MKIALWILGSIAGIVIVAWIGISVMIGLSVSGESSKAMEKFGGNRVEALVTLVDCTTCPVTDRTQAVWALGQLRDKRSLPILYKYYTGNPCDHQHMICQNELSKAIRWTEGKSFMLPRIWSPFLRDKNSLAVNNHP
jgi:hypothetical protein